MNKELSTSATISKLIQVVAKLRDPNHGCPWDLEQTHTSLIPYILEEAYEVVDAIRESDYHNLCEELGDLLLQIILHAQIANEEKHFTLKDITEQIIEKLIRRHPHVFLEKKVSNSNEVKESWSRIKKLEKESKSNPLTLTNYIKDKIRPHPAGFGAMYISKKVAKAGFEWKNIEDVWNKLYEEIDELKEALGKKDLKNANEELGDVIFTVINIARWYDLNPEEALEGTNKRFLNRFEYLESFLNGDIENQPIENLQLLWKEAKEALKVRDNS